MTKAIAFYLPQFHPIPENDEWWGKGFTEWSNTRRAHPLFEGHYQPHVPAEDDYYSLLDVSTQRKQIDLAKKYGIFGFCFYFYWFAGKTLLEKPIQQWLAEKTLEMPFCLCWANENWTRRWDGKETDILIDQSHSPLDDRLFIRYLLPYLRDKRYIRIKGRPLIVLYRPSLLPNARFTAAQWRYECKLNGIGEIHLSYVQSFEHEDPAIYGFDSAIEFPPVGLNAQDITTEFDGHRTDSSHRIYSYESIIQDSFNNHNPPYTFFRGVFPSWDNTARKMHKAASVIQGSSPILYRSWLQRASNWARQQSLRLGSDEYDLVFINAWNEWAEGCHLEPDKMYGHQWLEATRDALTQNPENQPPHNNSASDLSTSSKDNQSKSSNIRIAFVLHVFYIDVFSELLPKLIKNIGVTPHLKVFVTTTHNLAVDVDMLLSRTGIEFKILAYENRGRDVLPFLKSLPLLDQWHPDYVIKLHTKKSLHRDDGSNWLDGICADLLDSKSISACINRFESEPNLGIIGPRDNVVSCAYYLGSNIKWVQCLLKQINGSFDDFLSRNFVAGTMFMARFDALSALQGLASTHELFEQEDGQLDGTLAHAYERFISYYAYSECGLYTDSLDGKITRDFLYADKSEDFTPPSLNRGLTDFSKREVIQDLTALGWFDLPDTNHVQFDFTFAGWAASEVHSLDYAIICLDHIAICKASIDSCHPSFGEKKTAFRCSIMLVDIPSELLGKECTLSLYASTCDGRLIHLNNASKSILLPSEYPDPKVIRRFVTALSERPRRSGNYQHKKSDRFIDSHSLGSNMPRVVAFYLPQFHPIDINNHVWGDGFTEWCSVAQGKPFFPLHYQPRIPGMLGFYDLRDSEKHLEQISLANDFGIHAFCYYYYWFSGKQVLEMPISRYLSDSRFADHPYCICWANENWTKRWDGLDNDIILRQEYSESDPDGFIRSILPHIKRHNYLKIDGNPLLIIYNPSDIPNLGSVVSRWRHLCQIQGISLHLAYVRRGIIGEEEYHKFFDAGIEFPPQGLTSPIVNHRVGLPVNVYPGKIYDWDQMVTTRINQISKEGLSGNPLIYPGVCMGWDNTPRIGVNGNIFHGATPKRFEEWLRTIRDAQQRDLPREHQLIFVNAWNEWAEGTYLEPDMEFGYAYLNSLWTALFRG